MRICDIIAICWRNLTRRKMRTALTAFGVVIGVCAILVMISIGIGLEQYMTKQLESMGDLTLINVENWGGETPLTDEVLAEIKKIEGVQVVTPYENINIQIEIKTKKGRYESYANIYGVYPEAMPLLGYDLSSGEYLASGDDLYSMVVGQDFAYNFRDIKKRRGRGDRVSAWPDENGEIEEPFFDQTKEKYILYTQAYEEGKKNFEVAAPMIGVLKKDESAWETSNAIFMDIADVKEYEKQMMKATGQKVDKKEKDKGYTSARVKCVDIDVVGDVQTIIEDMGFSCYGMESYRKSQAQMMLMIQLVLGGLAAISLFVAAIGIANTMVMSIIERTREIGVMKVIGAEINNIRTLFLMEAGMIGLLGGIVGVICSLMISFGINSAAATLMGKMGGNMGGNMGGGMGGGEEIEMVISIIPPWLILFALTFSMLIGIIFGFLPANRAVKISALEAIKHD